MLTSAALYEKHHWPESQVKRKEQLLSKEWFSGIPGSIKTRLTWIRCSMTMVAFRSRLVMLVVSPDTASASSSNAFAHLVFLNWPCSRSKISVAIKEFTSNCTRTNQVRSWRPLFHSCLCMIIQYVRASVAYLSELHQLLFICVNVVPQFFVLRLHQQLPSNVERFLFGHALVFVFFT